MYHLPRHISSVSVLRPIMSVKWGIASYCVYTYSISSTRLTAPRTLNVAFEVAGARLCEYPSLSTLVLDHACKYLFQLARSDRPVVLQTSPLSIVYIPIP